MRRADADLDHFEPALDIALGVGDGLAVLARQEFGKRIIFALHEIEELHQHAHAPLRVGRGPGRLRRLGVLDRLAQIGLAAQRHLAADRAVHRLHDVLAASARCGDVLAANEMPDLGHDFSPW